MASLKAKIAQFDTERRLDAVASVLAPSLYEAVVTLDRSPGEKPAFINLSLAERLAWALRAKGILSFRPHGPTVPLRVDDRRIIANILRIEGQEYAAKVVERYEHDRPCHYKPECVMEGRCPLDPVCNN